MLADAYDVALFDLDGVVYLGPTAVEGAPEGIAALREHGVRVGFVTNNAACTPEHVADHLTELGVTATAEDVVTSSQAGARLLAQKVPAGAKVLVIGTEALADEVTAQGLTPVSSAAENPAAVIQGYHPTLPWGLINEGAHAVQQGALWVATNLDPTRPTDRGLVPGAGSQIQALGVAVDVAPLVAGKPCAPLMEESARRLGAERGIFVGDRFDTDIAGAARVGMDSLWVLTGGHGKFDLPQAEHLPTHIGHDLRALLEPARTPQVDQNVAGLDQARVQAADGALTIEAMGEGREAQLDALRCINALLATDRDLDAHEALAALTEVR